MSLLAPLRLSTSGWLLRLGGATVALLTLATPALAICYGTNEGAYGADFGNVRYGVKGEVDLASATPISGFAIAHPIQILHPSDNGDFIGWGTYKGNGPDDCPNTTTSNWNVYIDGTNFADYFCLAPFDVVTNGAQNQFYRVEFGWCSGYPDYQRWVLYWNGVQRACKTMSFNGGLNANGSESTTAQTQSLHLSYAWVEVKNSAGVWIDPSQVQQCEQDPPYFVTVSNGTKSWSIDQ